MDERRWSRPSGPLLVVDEQGETVVRPEGNYLLTVKVNWSLSAIMSSSA
jgi:hypothetical protein